MGVFHWWWLCNSGGCSGVVRSKSGADLHYYNYYNLCNILHFVPSTIYSVPLYLTSHPLVLDAQVLSVCPSWSSCSKSSANGYLVTGRMNSFKNSSPHRENENSTNGRCLSAKPTMSWMQPDPSSTSLTNVSAYTLWYT
jgi:hypothetical protein